MLPRLLPLALRRSFPSARELRRGGVTTVAGLGFFACILPGQAQVAPNPAGTETALPPAQVTPAHNDLSHRQLREADDAYLKGARALDKGELREAEAEFGRAVQLAPRNHDYALALAVSREHRLTDLVQRAAKERVLGHTELADSLLVQAHEIDPQNTVVAQHFLSGEVLAPAPGAKGVVPESASRTDALNLAGPVVLAPAEGTRSFHLKATAPDLLRQICDAYGIKVKLVNEIPSGAILRFDVENADFGTSLRILQTLTHSFSVPLQPKELLVSADTPENRAQYVPLIEETLYIPGTTPENMTEYANLARNVFNLRVVNAVANAGSLVLRGDEDSLAHVNATFADLVDGGSDVLLDLTLFEVDKSRINNVGVQLPSSVGAFPVAATAESLITANQSLIAEAVANNLITLTGNAYTDALTELEFLLASGTVSSSEFTNLLGVVGHYGGLPLAGIYLGSTSTLNGALTSSDVRILDTLQLRIGDKQDGQFRAGTRYPIETGIYSSNVSSSVASAVAGLTINGTSVSSLLSAATAVSVPQIQYEDLGLTLKATPQVLRTGEVSVKLDFKLEALGSGTINTLPILNSRQLTSTVTIPRGRSAMLTSEVSQSEIRALTGIPFLSEIPGFRSTNQDTEKDSMELVITLTPHIVRNKNMQITSRRLLLANGNAGPTQ